MIKNNKKGLAVVFLLAILLVASFLVFSQRNSEPEPVEEEEAIDPEEFLEGSPVFRIEEELLSLEEQLGENMVDDYLFEEYYEIENRFFIIRDLYFEGVDEEDLLEEIESLLIQIENLEEEIKNINNNQ